MTTSPSPRRRARLAALALVLGLGVLTAIGAGGLGAAPATAAEETFSLWSDAAVPRVVSDPDQASVELGVRFRADRDGVVTGVRFYKGPRNTGTHTGTLWDGAGTPLAQVRFANETASGWQRATFAEPVPIRSGATYVASYHAPRGRYSVTERYFTRRGVTNGPLTAPRSTPEALNGVYAYGTDVRFPTSSYGDSNYWVDVLFTPAPVAAPPTAPTGVTAVRDREDIAVRWTASTATDAPISEYVVLRDGAEVGRVAGDVLTFTDRDGLVDGTEYRYQVRAVDSRGAGSPLSTEAPVTYVAAVSIWPDGSPATPPVEQADPDGVELGVRFRSGTSGKVLGVRFYKAAASVGAHTGSLWDARGNRLATISFATSGSERGWQRAYFDQPVAIRPRTTYVVSYHAPGGGYAAQPGYFHDRDAANGPLTALQNHADGENGVFRYGASAFPNRSHNATNYWVDVVFRPDHAATAPSVPSGLRVTQNQDEVTLTWSPSTDRLHPVAGYELYRDGVRVARTDAATLRHVDTAGLVGGTTYGYQVRAVDAVGETSDLSPEIGLVYLPPTRPVPVADLRRVPWEGGPDFYADVPQAVARGWTSPDFFPIGLWGATVENQRDVDTDRAVGINTYLELYQANGTEDPDFAAIRGSGMSAIHGITDAADVGAETVGWFIDDEPEQHVTHPSEVLPRLERLKAALPDDERLHYTNFTGNMMLPNYTPGDETAARWIDTSDVVSLDIYWYTRDLVCGGSVGGEIWKDGSGAPQRDGNGYNDLSFDECHRASNYGYQVAAQRRLAALSGATEPVYAFIETGHPFTGTEDRGIAPDQLAGAVWSSLIHEARGINYFNHSFSGPCQSSNVLRDPVYQGRDCYSAIRERTRVVNAQVTRLAPVLNTQSWDYRFNPKLDTMLKEMDGSYYVFAMPSGVRGGSAIGRQTLRLPLDIDASSAEVLFEDRTVPITGGELTDTFAADHSYHVYKITP